MTGLSHLENGNGNSVGSSEGSYSLRWNSFETHLTKGMGKLLEEDEFTDVTLACDGQYLKAHKVLLSLCSPYFKRLFQTSSGNDKTGTTIVILGNVRFTDLENIIRFVYHGQTNVSQSDLSRFLKAGELLQIEGLAQTQLPKQVAEDDDVVALPTPPSSRAHQGPTNDSTRSNSNKVSDRSCSNRTTSRQRSHGEVPQLVDGQQDQPRNKRIKIVSTSSVVPKLHSPSAVTKNGSPVPVSLSVAAREQTMDPLSTDSGYSTVLPEENTVNSHIVCQERDPLGTEEPTEALSTRRRQSRIHDLQDELIQFSASDHNPQDNDIRLEESHSGHYYGNSSVMETSNGLCEPQDQDGETVNVSHHHQSISKHGNREFPQISISSSIFGQHDLTGKASPSQVAELSTSGTLLGDTDQNLPYYLPSFSSITTEEVTTCTMCAALIPMANYSEHMFSVHSVLNARNHLAGRVECPICFRLLKNKNSLKVHKSIYHRVTKPTVTRTVTAGDTSFSILPEPDNMQFSVGGGHGNMSTKLEKDQSN